MSWIKGDTPTEQKYFDYLERLRESGATNMFGARPYLQRQFGITPKEASEVLGKWMRYHNDPARELSGPGSVEPSHPKPRAVLLCQGGYCDNTELDPGEELCGTCEDTRGA